MARAAKPIRNTIINGDEDGDRAPLLAQRPHRMTPVAVRLMEPDGMSGVSDGRL